MAYDLFDVRGWVGGGPTISGMAAFRAWVETWPAASIPVLRAFVTHGETAQIAALIGELEGHVATGPVETIRTAFLNAATRAHGVLILSDGG